MLRARLKYACVTVSFLAAVASFFSGATMTAVVSLCAVLIALFLDWGKAIDKTTFKELIETLHPNARESDGAIDTRLRGYHTHWVAIVTTISVSHVIFRDEVGTTEWRQLITRLNHGSVLRAKPRQATN